MSRQLLAMVGISIANQWLAEGDRVSGVHHMAHTSCAVALDLSVVVRFCVFLLPAHMMYCDVAPLSTGAAVLLYKCG